MKSSNQITLLCILLLKVLHVTTCTYEGIFSLPTRRTTNAFAFLQSRSHRYNNNNQRNFTTDRLVYSTSLNGMKRPILDQIASALFKLEQDRVDSSSVIDDKGRYGEPMEWSQKSSFANRFSELIASNDVGYQFKQWVADIVAGDYNEEETVASVQRFVEKNQVAMFSFTTCPFCRGAKDYLEAKGIPYSTLELDELDGNKGNEIRAALGKITRRTSVPSIFINGIAVGGLNDGMPGLLPLGESGELDVMLAQGKAL